VGKALREFVPPVYNFSKKYKVRYTQVYQNRQQQQQ
jgi:hypothetical protein